MWDTVRETQEVGRKRGALPCRFLARLDVQPSAALWRRLAPPSPELRVEHQLECSVRLRPVLCAEFNQHHPAPIEIPTPAHP